MNDQIETQKLIVLSTSHLSDATLSSLRKQEIYGFYYVMECGRWLMRMPDENKFYSNDLRQIYEFAKELGVAWIMFDERADSVAGLVNYR